MDARRLQTDLLLQAGRLLLEYNESTEEIRRALVMTASALTAESCQVSISYGGVAISFAGEAAALATVRELRYNMAVQAGVHHILERVRQRTLDVPAAQMSLSEIEAHTARHSRWLIALLLGAAAASLACLLGADASAAAVAGVATWLGSLVRQHLGRQHVSLLALPLTAAFIGAILAGVAIRLGWTGSPELVLIVPALMLIPGPHVINALLDLIDNHVPMSVSRLGLATGILLASSLGVVLGVELVFPGPLFIEHAAKASHLTLGFDMALAALATCGFAVFYNAPWPQVGLAAVAGMAGHGLRFVALEAGWRLEAAAFLGGFTVGALSGWIARANKTPVATIAFAGAVTMIPGLTLYRALHGVLQMARLPGTPEPQLVAATAGNAFQGSLVLTGLALGLILGTRTVLALSARRNAAVGPHSERSSEKAAPGSEHPLDLHSPDPGLIGRLRG